MNIDIKKSLLMLTTALVLTGPAFAQTMDEGSIVLSGVVSDVTDNEFNLTYSPGNDSNMNSNSATANRTIKVEMDGWLNELDESLTTGDRVVVSGTLDDDFLEGREIEADSIYFADSNSYYGESAANSIPLYYYSDNYIPSENNTQEAMQDGSTISMTGVVQSRSDDEFTMNTGNKNIRVEMDDWFIDETKVSQGDRVHVIGHLDDDLFEGSEIEADNVTVLSHNIR